MLRIKLKPQNQPHQYNKHGGIGNLVPNPIPETFLCASGIGIIPRIQTQTKSVPIYPITCTSGSAHHEPQTVPYRYRQLLISNCVLTILDRLYSYSSKSSDSAILAGETEIHDKMIGKLINLSSKIGEVVVANSGDSTPQLRLPQSQMNISQLRELESMLSNFVCKDPHPLLVSSFHHDLKRLVKLDLTKLSFNWILLSKPSYLPVNFNEKWRKELEGPRRLQYSFQRVCSVLLTFFQRVGLGIYPEPPPLHCIWPQNFADLKAEVKILQLLADWRIVLQSSIDINTGDINLSYIIVYINQFLKTFDRYYREERVLMPTGTEHMYPTMFLRIYIYSGIRSIMLILLDLLSPS